MDKPKDEKSKEIWVGSQLCHLASSSLSVSSSAENFIFVLIF